MLTARRSKKGRLALDAGDTVSDDELRSQLGI